MANDDKKKPDPPADTKPEAAPKLAGRAFFAACALPESFDEAGHNIAFALNTGTAGNEAPKKIAKYSNEQCVALLKDCSGLDQEQVTELLRERFPEPKAT